MCCEMLQTRLKHMVHHDEKKVCIDCEFRFVVLPDRFCGETAGSTKTKRKFVDLHNCLDARAILKFVTWPPDLSQNQANASNAQKGKILVM